MKNKEILKKAIEKIGYRSEHTDEYLRIIDDINIVKTATEVIYLSKRINELVFLIIFSHNFAEAFWGEDIIIERGVLEKNGNISSEYENKYKCWEYHLQQLVLEEDPIKYLEKFI